MYFSKEDNKKHLLLRCLVAFGNVFNSWKVFKIKIGIRQTVQRKGCLTLWSFPKINFYEIDNFNRWTSGIFFSSANAIETSAWHMINSMAPEPESYMYESVKTNDNWKFKIRKLNVKILEWHLFSAKWKNNLPKYWL